MIRAYIEEFDGASVKGLIEVMEQAMEIGQPFLPLLICSGGGDLFSAFAMVDIIRSSPIPVMTIGLGHAQSAGALLLASGTKGMRYAAPRTTIMVHEVITNAGGASLSAHEIEVDAKETARLNEEMCNILDVVTGKRRSTWAKTLRKSRDLVLTPEQALKHHLIDVVGFPWIKMRPSEPEILIATG